MDNETNDERPPSTEGGKVKVRFAMVDLRMVADDRGYMQLQVRNRVIGVGASGALCDGGSWEEWRSVPIVHDLSQLVDKVDSPEQHGGR